MLAILLAFSIAAAADPASSPDDKNIHACPDAWEVGSTQAWEVGSGDAWEVGDSCTDKDGQTWTWDGVIWASPNSSGTNGQTW